MNELSIKGRLYRSLMMFALCILLIPFSVSAQCGDCDDRNPCTKDYCYNGTRCIHDPIDCDGCQQSNSSVHSETPSIGIAETAGTHDRPMGDNPSSDMPSRASGNTQSGAESDMQSGSTPGAPSETVGSAQPEPGPASSVALLNAEFEVDCAVLQPVDCGDADSCTIEGSGGINCANGPKDCNNGSASTTDYCSEGACVNEPIVGAAENAGALDSVNETLLAFAPSCDDGNLCTIDSFNGKSCEHTPLDCDDGNDSTFDYCYEGVCFHSQTSCDDGNPCTVDSFNGTSCIHWPKNCDDANACTADYCEDGNCVHERKRCDDGNACTVDSCHPKEGCTHTWRDCDDGDPCTIDTCDSYWGCINTPVICGSGKTCVDGYCVDTTPKALPATAYTIPAGSRITLPWGSEVTALQPVQVTNGVAYAAGSPLKFVQYLGDIQAAVTGQSDGQPPEKAMMLGLTWQTSPMSLTLIQPDGSVLLPESDTQNIEHVTGGNYDYYFLTKPASGYWTMVIVPANPGTSGKGYFLISGLVGGFLPPASPNSDRP